MKDMIKKTLLEMSHNNISLDTDSDRDYIADKLIRTFRVYNLLLYSDLEKHNQSLGKVERGL